MLVLFTCFWGSTLSIQAEVGKLNEDLLQPSEIRYEAWSFSVRHLISITYWKVLISRVKLSIVVPQDIGISLCNSSRMEQDKEGKNSYCSLFPFLLYLCIVKTKDCWMHVWLKIECVYLLKIIMNAGIVNSLPNNGHEWAHVHVGKAWRVWKPPLKDLDLGN